MERRINVSTEIPFDKIWDGFFESDFFDLLYKHTKETPREIWRLTELCYRTALDIGSNFIMKADVASALVKYSEEQLDNLDSQNQYRYRGLKKILIHMFNGIEKEFAYKKLEEKLMELQTNPIFTNPENECSWIQGYVLHLFLEMLFDLDFLFYKPNRTSKPEKFYLVQFGSINDESYFAINPIYAPGLRCVGN